MPKYTLVLKRTMSHIKLLALPLPNWSRQLSLVLVASKCAFAICSQRTPYRHSQMALELNKIQNLVEAVKRVPLFKVIFVII